MGPTSRYFDEIGEAIYEAIANAMRYTDKSYCSGVNCYAGLQCQNENTGMWCNADRLSWLRPQNEQAANACKLSGFREALSD